MPASGNSVETSEAILDAATAEFAAKGLAGAWVEKIVARAGHRKEVPVLFTSPSECIMGAE